MSGKALVSSICVKYLWFVLAIFLWNCSSNSCNDVSSEETRTCPTYSRGILETHVTMSGSYTIQRVLIYRGNVEDRDTLFDLPQLEEYKDMSLEPGYYSGEAWYVGERDTILAIDGTRIKAGGEEVECDESCSVPRGVLDLKLK